MTIGDVNEQGNYLLQVMLTNQGYCFGDVNEQVYFSDATNQVNDNW